MTYYPIIRICCSCNKFLGMKDGGTTPNQVSHGYCTECQEELKKQIELMKTKEVA